MEMSNHKRLSQKDFKPAWWLPNSHLQTLWPFLCRRPLKNFPLKRERFELPDGDFIDVDWAGEGDGPIVLLLHGFEGTIESHYAKSMLKIFCNHGWRGAFIFFRGCSGQPNRLPRGYHSGETKDVTLMLERLQEREPRADFAAVGFSLGGNVLLKWLGESGKNNPLKAAVAISVPFELQKVVNRINQGFSRTYQWYLLKCATERLAKKFQTISGSIDSSVFSKIKTIRELDNQVTAPLHGFADAHDYYLRASSRQFLNSIRVPTLIIHAKDDPFMTEDVVPEPQELSSSIKLEATENGGHVGFVGGKYPWAPEYWLEKRVPDFLQDFL